MRTIGIVGPAVLSAAFIMAFNSVCLAQKAKIPVNDQNVEASINKAVQFLLSKQKADGSWDAFLLRDVNPPWDFKDGPTAMSIYTLVASGIPVKDPKITRALDWLTKPENQSKYTYCMAFRCLAWYTVNKQLDNKYRKNFEADVEAFIKATPEGSYHYISDPSKPTKIGDNSNSQYGIYAVWTGARAGMEIPREYWDKCLKRWISKQHPNGGWDYQDQIKGSMTVAGIASLFICIDWLYADKFVKCQGGTDLAAIKKGLEWMDANFQDTVKWLNPYYLYGVERVGLASGYKYFGEYDWYKAGASLILNEQHADGSWGREAERIISDTCYSLLFLIRGRLPVLINRLEYDGDWNNRPRALANFCRWSEKAFETEANWQIITLKSDVNEWHDAPVLAITGSKEPKFSAEDIEKLRAFVYQGGTLLSITECGGAPFGAGIRNLYKKLFPKYELALCGKDHLLNTIIYKIPPAIRIHEISNGIRPLAIHVDNDLPLSWQQYQVATGKVNFEAAANAVMYVTDKQFKYRGSKAWPAEPKTAPAKSVKVARLRFAGNYDPEPLAMQRLARLMAMLYDLKVDCIPAGQATPVVTASQPSGPPTGITPAELTADVKLAVMAGTGGFKLSAEEKDSLKKWIAVGGILLLDAAGSKTFFESARNLADELFGADALLPLPVSSQVYQIKDMTIEKVKYRRVTRARVGGIKEPRLLAVLKVDRPMVLVSQEDITGGLVGYASATCDGYEPESAFDVMRNVVLYAASAPPLPADTPAASAPVGK
ncbi:MAG: DUF4159 domain-containing protein [Planctomycetes bacterium]|nr:DUF4159 domain-containing protein [Planctomycetota bacterium]